MFEIKHYDRFSNDNDDREDLQKPDVIEYHEDDVANEQPIVEKKRTQSRFKY